MMMMSRGRAMMMHAVENNVAGRATERFSLPYRLLVDLEIHDDHHQARYPKRNAGTDERVRHIHSKLATLKSQERDSKIKNYVFIISL